MKLLLVEDEAILAKSVAKVLRRQGYAVDLAADGEEALELYRLNQYDLMILDLNLPKIDGMEVLRTIREQDRELRILILSARNAVEDKIAGLDTGSNDYLTKPFDFGELEARIRNLLRQRVRLEHTRLSCGELVLDTAGKQVWYRGQEIELTRKEYSILEYLMAHPGKVVSAEELTEHVWDSETDLFSNSFRFHISSLRKKLETVTGPGGMIVTVWGQGYRMAGPKEGIL